MIGFDEADIRHLRCPRSRELLSWDGAKDANGILQHGTLTSPNDHVWRIDEGVASLAERYEYTLKDQVVDVVYDLLAPVHDLSVDYLLPVLQYPGNDPVRHNYVQRLALDQLPTDEGPVRILEIGCGTGANIPLIKHACRRIGNLEIWAVDFNRNMLEGCAKNNADSSTRLRLALADAHDLPFADNTFDRVFHVGGINIYRDAERALREMARVAKPETEILVVDEGLDTQREDTCALHHFAFFWLTSLDNFTGAPEDKIPDNCVHVSTSNVSRFYYAMVFKKLA